MLTHRDEGRSDLILTIYDNGIQHLGKTTTKSDKFNTALSSCVEQRKLENPEQKVARYSVKRS